MQNIRKLKRTVKGVDLMPGMLFKMRDNTVCLYIGRSKDKKTWRRKYYFLINGCIMHTNNLNMLEVIEVHNETR